MLGCPLLDFKDWKRDKNHRFTVLCERRYSLYLQMIVTKLHCTFQAYLQDKGVLVRRQTSFFFLVTANYNFDRIDKNRQWLGTKKG